MPFQAAFYKGNHAGVPGIYNRLVKARGRGLYSHGEMVFSDGLSASSSFMDHGVRFKQIDYSKSTEWDFINLPPEMEAYARAYFIARLGFPYDLMGNVFLTIGFVNHSTNALFCSEALAEALQIPEGFRFEPNALAALLGSPIFQNRVNPVTIA